MWGGFWGGDHHVWVETEFAEVADLSVSRLHEHPASHRQDALPAPPIWWRLGDWSPEVFLYLPDHPALPDFDDAEGTAELFGFLELVRARFADTLAKAHVGDIVRPQLLDSDDALRRLAAQNDRWAKTALAVKKMGLPFPAWIQERQAELMECWQAGREAPSRWRGTAAL